MPTASDTGINTGLFVAPSRLEISDGAIVDAVRKADRTGGNDKIGVALACT